MTTSNSAIPTRPTSERGPPASVRRFVLLFLVAFVGLEALVVGVLWREAVFQPFAGWSARLGAALARPWIEEARGVGDYLVSPTFSVRIRPSCDPFQACAVLLAGILAFPASPARKLAGALAGSLLLFALNGVRLASVLWIGVHRPELFDPMHLEILPGLFVLLALGLWLGWTLWARPRRAA